MSLSILQKVKGTANLFQDFSHVSPVDIGDKVDANFFVSIRFEGLSNLDVGLVAEHFDRLDSLP